MNTSMHYISMYKWNWIWLKEEIVKQRKEVNIHKQKIKCKFGWAVKDI